MNRPKLLIVNNEEHLRDNLAGVFSRKGYKVTSTGSSEDAFADYRTAHFDAALIEFETPYSSCTRLVTKLKENNPEIVCLIINGTQNVKGIIATSGQSVNGFINTPVDAASVAERLGRVMNKYRQDPEPGNTYKDLYEFAPIAYIFFDSDCIIRGCNLGAVELLGYSKDEIVGKDLLDLYGTRKKHRDEAIRIIEASKHSHAPLSDSVMMQKSNGVPVWINQKLQSNIDSQGRLTGGRLVLADITDQMIAESRLKKSEMNYRLLFESTIDCLIHLDNSGTIVGVNRQMSDLTGRKKDYFAGKKLGSLTEVLTENSLANVAPLLTGNILEQPASPLEIEARASDGGQLFFEITLVPLKEPAGLTVGKLAVLHDITDRKESEVQIATQRAQLEASNDELTALYEVSSAISRTINLNELLVHILDTITRLNLFEFERKAGIFIVEDNHMRLAAHRGHNEVFLNLHKDMRIGDCLCGLAAETGCMVFSKNSHEDDRHSIRYEGMEKHGHVILPLKVLKRVVGVLYLYVAPDSEISQRKFNLLSSLGNQLGIAIENAKLYEETKMLSLHDPLTGLANRNMMQMEVEKSLARSRRYKSPLSFIMLDLDFFKNYNDTYGHSAGDKLLIDVADTIKGIIRQVDLAARYGGEEFLIILPDTDSTAAVEVAERIRRKIEVTNFYHAENEPPSRMTVSEGISTNKDGEIDSEDTLIKMADNALYKAKHKGRNRVEVYGDNADSE